MIADNQQERPIRYFPFDLRPLITPDKLTRDIVGAEIHGNSESFYAEVELLRQKSERGYFDASRKLIQWRMSRD